jgi:hypothetical protein
VPVSDDVQSAISQRYGQLADSITHARREEERAVLAPDFVDRAKQKLESFEYDALTVVVRKMDTNDGVVTVQATYVGVNGHSADTIDRWEKHDGQWVLLSRK